MKQIERVIEFFICSSRWLLVPLYIGLVVVQVIYVYRFLLDLWHLIVGVSAATELTFLLGVLGLVDVIMVANLISMVIMGGYATFVSKLKTLDSAEKPEWLSHIDPGTIKVKLAASLVGISSIHLLRTFLNIHSSSDKELIWQTGIHLTFVISTVLLALSENIMASKHHHHLHENE